MRVVMAVMWDLANDARVRREATALAVAGHDVTLIGFDYSVARRTTSTERGVEIIHLPLPSRDRSRWVRAAGAVWFWVRASRIILSTRADVYHSHNLHFAIPILAAAARYQARVVYDAHELVGTRSRGVRRALGLRYEARVWKRCDAVVTTNESRAAFLQSRHGGLTPVVVGNYPDDPEGEPPFELRDRIGVGKDERVLIYQGGLYLASRCFDVVAGALRLLPAWHWVIIGFGSTTTVDALHEEIRRAGVDDRVHILDAVPAPQLLHLTADADIGIVPLRSSGLNNYYGDTNKLFEYLLAGIPAVGSDFPEVRRAILDNPIGPVGQVFNPADPRSVAAAIGNVESDLDTLKLRAATVGTRLYSWRAEQHKVVDLYAALDRRGHVRSDASQPTAEMSEAVR